METKFISPQQLFDDPKQWLNVPHEHHEVLTQLMSKMFNCDWKQKLKDATVHCLRCEGQEPIPVTKGNEKGEITGYIEKPEKLLNIRKQP